MGALLRCKSNGGGLAALLTLLLRPDGRGEGQRASTIAPRAAALPSTPPPSPPPAAQVHKLLQGLIDQYSLAGQEAALGMAEGMASYFCGRCGLVWYTNRECMVSVGL